LPDKHKQAILPLGDGRQTDHLDWECWEACHARIDGCVVGVAVKPIGKRLVSRIR
jgi:hypothetical protein